MGPMLIILSLILGCPLSLDSNTLNWGVFTRLLGTVSLIFRCLELFSHECRKEILR